MVLDKLSLWSADPVRISLGKITPTLLESFPKAQKGENKIK
jgi:hypothetical protein